MKNIPFLAAFLMCLTFGFSQGKMTDIAKKNKGVQFEYTAAKTNKVAPKGITIWQNDFSDNSEWTYDNTSTPYLNWEITTAADTIPVTGLNPALFTTVSNGFAFINSDAQGQNGAQNSNMTYTGTIDCSAYPNVCLVFEQSYRTYLDTRIVRISNDGGSSWTDFIITDGTEPTAQNSANPDIASINISSVAGGQASVMVQLNYQGNWGWYWAIDDIKIIETDQYDLKLQSITWGTDGPFGERLAYYQIPNNQVAPIYFGGVVQNIGVQNITDAIFTANINALYSGLSSPSPIAAASGDTLWCTTTFTPAAVNASHSIQFGTSSSQTELDLSNNTQPNINVVVNDDIYARDKGIIQGGIFNTGQGFEAGPVYDIFTNSTLYGIDGYIGLTAVEGAEIFAKLYSINPSTGAFDFMDESLPYIIMAGDLGQKHTFGLQSPQALLAGESYLVVVGSYGDGGATNDLVIATSGGAAASTVFYFDYTDQTWYYTSSSCMVRMNFDQSLGLDKLEDEASFQITPNPSSGEFTIQTKEAFNGQVTVSDLSGKVIYSSEMTGLNLNVSSQHLVNGVYLVSLTEGSQTNTQKLIIKR